MDREVGALVEAFRGELEGCHQFLDQTGCPRSINGKVLTLKDRIMVLVAADHEYVGQVGDAIREVRSIKGLMDQYDEIGRLHIESQLPPLTQRVADNFAELFERAERRRQRRR